MSKTVMKRFFTRRMTKKQPLLDRYEAAMKVLSSLKSAKKRDKNCRVVRRKGRVYVINKTKPLMKARQG